MGGTGDGRVYIPVCTVHTHIDWNNSIPTVHLQPSTTATYQIMDVVTCVLMILGSTDVSVHLDTD